MSIVITRDGDAVELTYRTMRLSTFPEPATLVKQDGEAIGEPTHRVCGGCVDRLQTTDRYAVLHCRRCGLRVVIPQEVQTVGELRAWSAQSVLAERRTTKAAEQAEQQAATGNPEPLSAAAGPPGGEERQR